MLMNEPSTRMLVFYYYFMTDNLRMRITKLLIHWASLILPELLLAIEPRHQMLLLMTGTILQISLSLWITIDLKGNNSGKAPRAFVGPTAFEYIRTFLYWADITFCKSGFIAVIIIMIKHLMILVFGVLLNIAWYTLLACVVYTGASRMPIDAMQNVRDVTNLLENVVSVMESDFWWVSKPNQSAEEFFNCAFCL